VGWQQLVVLIIVVAALGYLVWKLSAGSRPKRRGRKGPDVPVSNLTRKHRSSSGGASSCH